VSYFSLTLLFTLCACCVDYAFVIVVIKESYYYYYYYYYYIRLHSVYHSLTDKNVNQLKMTIHKFINRFIYYQLIN